MSKKINQTKVTFAALLSMAALAYLLFFQKYSFNQYHQDFTGNLIPFGPITYANPYEECVPVAPEWFDHFSTLIGTYMRVNTNNLIINFYDGPVTPANLVSQSKVASKTLVDNQPLSIDFPRHYFAHGICFGIYSNECYIKTIALFGFIVMLF